METIFIPDLIFKIFKINTVPVEKTERAYEKHNKTIMKDLQITSKTYL